MTTSTTGLECPHCHSLDEEAYEHTLDESPELIGCDNCGEEFLASQEVTVTYTADTVAAYSCLIHGEWVWDEEGTPRRPPTLKTAYRSTKAGAYWAAWRMYATQQAAYAEPMFENITGVGSEQLWAHHDLGSSRVDEQSPLPKD